MWEQFNQSGSITISHWEWTRWKKGKFVEDESYEWSDVENERRLGVRVRDTKYFIFFREIRYKQREHNYWIERAGGWRIKIPFCKTYEQTRIANWIVVDFPIFILCLWRMFSEHPIRWCHSRAAESYTRPAREKQGALLSLSITRQNIHPVASRGFLLPEGTLKAVTRDQWPATPASPSTSWVSLWLPFAPMNLMPPTFAGVPRQ